MENIITLLEYSNYTTLTDRCKFCHFFYKNLLSLRRYKFGAEKNSILVTNYDVNRTDAAITHKTLKMESILMQDFVYDFSSPMYHEVLFFIFKPFCSNHCCS